MRANRHIRVSSRQPQHIGAFENQDPGIDFVIPWVDSTDSAWIAEKNKYLKGNDQHELSDDARYRDWGTLKYWFRGVDQFAPWVRKIHFITCGHLPKWLNTSHPKLNIVNHSDYIPGKYLPTFSSHTIELNLHRIEGLADQFVYFNDDMFLCKPVLPIDFFDKGLPKDSAALNVHCYALDAPIQMIQIQNTGIINAHFNFKASLRDNILKWLTPANEAKLLRTIILAGCPRYPGFYEPHSAPSYLKTTFEDVWAAEPALLDKTCMHRFRELTDVNQWVFRDWQLASGRFLPRPMSFTRRFFFEDYQDRIKVAEDAARCIRKQSTGIICVNDYEMEAGELEACKSIIIAAFEELLPLKSSFEME